MSEVPLAVGVCPALVPRRPKGLLGTKGLQGTVSREIQKKKKSALTSPPALSLQGYLAHEKQPPPRTLQKDYV